MSNPQQTNTNQNQQRQGGTTRRQQLSNPRPNQSTRDGGEQLWNAMNARVGNQRAQPIDPRLVPQAVGPIQGVAPTARGNQVQRTAQGTGGQYGQPMALQPFVAPQGNNAATYSSQPQGIRVAQPPQQPTFNPQGNQQYTFNPPATPYNQQSQTGHTMQRAAQPTAPGGTATSGNIPVPPQYPRLPPSHGIPGRRADPRPGAQQTWRVDGPR